MSGYIQQEEGAPARAASESIDWCSPLWVTDGVHQVLGGIDLDPCANPGSIPRIMAKVNYYLPDHGDGLADPWGGSDPYDKRILICQDGQLKWVETQAPAPVVQEGITRNLEALRVVKNGYSNPPFGTYYIHAHSKEILVPKDFHARAEELVGDGNPKTAKDGEFRMSKEDWKKAVGKMKKAMLSDDVGDFLSRGGWERHSIADWVKKASDEADKHDLNWIHLGPASVGVKYWRKYVEKTAAAVLFIGGRLRFELVDFTTLKVISTGNAAPMDCALVLWTKDPAVLKRFAEVFGDKGSVHLLDSGFELLNMPNWRKMDAAKPYEKLRDDCLVPIGGTLRPLVDGTGYAQLVNDQVVTTLKTADVVWVSQ